MAVGRVQPSNLKNYKSRVTSGKESVGNDSQRPRSLNFEFISRHTIDGKFLFVDQRYQTIWYYIHVKTYLLNEAFFFSLLYEKCHPVAWALATGATRHKYVRILSCWWHHGPNGDTQVCSSDNWNRYNRSIKFQHMVFYHDKRVCQMGTRFIDFV